MILMKAACIEIIVIPFEYGCHRYGKSGRWGFDEGIKK